MIMIGPLGIRGLCENKCDHDDCHTKNTILAIFTTFY